MLTFIGIPVPQGITQEIRDLIANQFAAGNTMRIFVSMDNVIWLPIEWVNASALPNNKTMTATDINNWYDIVKQSGFAELNINWTLTQQTIFAPATAASIGNDTNIVSLDSTIDSRNDTVNVIDQAQTAIVQELPDSVVNALETTGNVTQNIVDTIYTATRANTAQQTDSSQSPLEGDAEKTARAKKVLLGISAGILAFKIFS